MNLYNRILGHPFVYNTIRPIIVGGIDQSTIYRALEVTKQDVILDVGCGTGDALNYLDCFKQYWGFDIDSVAISYAEKSFGVMQNVTFKTKLVEKNDVDKIQPSRVILAGLLHHLSDDEVLGLFFTLARSRVLQRIVTQDIVYLPGEFVSNILARLDRGRFCRKQEEYESLIKKTGFDIVYSMIIRSHSTDGRAKYLIMTIEPR